MADAFAVIFTATGKRWQHNSLLLLDWFVSQKNSWWNRNNVTYVILVARHVRDVIWRKQESASKQSYSEVTVLYLVRMCKDFSLYSAYTRKLLQKIAGSLPQCVERIPCSLLYFILEAVKITYLAAFHQLLNSLSFMSVGLVVIRGRFLAEPFWVLGFQVKKSTHFNLFQLSHIYISMNKDSW